MTDQLDDTGRRRPIRKHEIEARKKAMTAARATITAKGSLNRDDVAAEYGATPSTVSQAIVILQHGTEEEIAGVESGERGLRVVYDDVCKRVSVKDRYAARLQPKLSAERKAQSTQERLVWTNLRQALALIGSLPQPKDVVKIVKRNHARTATLDRSILDAFSWLSEFSDEWTK